MRNIFLISIVVGCSLIALRRPIVGLYTFVCLGFLSPNSFTWTSAPLSQITAIATLLGYLFSSERKRFPVVRETILLIMLWVTFAFTTTFAIYQDRALERLIYISKVFLMIFLSTSLINTEARLHLLVEVIAFSLGFHALKGGIFVLLTGGEYMVWGPEYTYLHANNAIGLAMAMNIPLLVLLLRIGTHRWLRCLTMAMLFLSYPAIFATYSRGAWLGLVIVTGLVALSIKYKLRVLAVALVVGIFLGPSLLELFPDRGLDRYDQLINYEQEQSAESRFWNWEFCRRVGMANPLHGGGFDFYGRELYYEYYPEFVYRWGPDKYWSCHSVWYTIFAEHGIPGFILWIALMGSCFLSLRQIRLFGKTHGGFLWATHYAQALQASFFGYFIIGTFLDTAYFDIFYYLVGIVIIIKGLIARAETESPQPAKVGDFEIPTPDPKRV